MAGVRLARRLVACRTRARGGASGTESRTERRTERRTGQPTDFRAGWATSQASHGAAPLTTGGGDAPPPRSCAPLRPSLVHSLACSPPPPSSAGCSLAQPRALAGSPALCARCAAPTWRVDAAGSGAA
eukprot:CAMPEP_0202088670 /NCGR_PEP_ID=MMETSP0964-20121228/39193_1 /ASSEMBLY_ACC=CAM_ASM_000500 /TAXON_ID=4773 /ORGANISM="Schizochytrium aggregatum, Strain ATCC28209" /LENGTH=127 /DNA_ID=CAMNT_0048656701 /DNA_START=417 /DNA_END=798 /DNA_ORIENTATION=+